MSLLSISGLKKAYESLEGEITRTFDSSRAAEPTETAAPVPTDETSTGTEKDQSSPLTSRGDEVRREGEEKEEGDGERWGEWEEQDSYTTRGRGMQLSKKTEESPNPSPLPQSTSDGSLVTSSPVASSTPAKTGGKLDSRPRAELVKYIKKQAQLLQKSKARCDELSKECSKLKQTCTNTTGSEALVDELQVVRSERDSAVRERKTLQQTVAGLEQDKQTVREQVVVLENEVKQLQSREDDWRCREEVAATKLTAQQQEVERVGRELQDRLATAEQELEATRERETKLQAERREMERELESRLASAGREIGTGRVREAELRGEITALGERLETAVREVERGREEVGRVRGEAKEAREAAEKEIEREGEEKATLEAELTHLRRQLSEASRTSTTEEEELRSELCHLREQLTSVTSERESLQTELSVSKSGLEAAHVEKDSVAAEMEKMKSELRQLREQLAHETDERERLQTKLRTGLETAQSERDSSEADMKKTREELITLQREHEMVREQMKVMETSQNDLRTECETLRRERDCLQGEFQEVRREKEELQTASDSLQHDYVSLKETHRTEREERVKQAELRASVAEEQLLTSSRGRASGEESAVCSNVELEQKIQSLESRLASVSTEKDSLVSVTAEQEAKLETFQKLCEEKEEEITVLKNELEQSRHKLTEVEGEYAALRETQEGVAEEREREVERLREEVADETERRLGGVVEEGEREVERLKKEMAELQHDRQETEKRLGGVAEEREREVERLKKEIAELQRRWQEMEKRLGCVAEEQEREMERLKKEMADETERRLGGVVEEGEREVERLKKEIAELQREMERRLEAEREENQAATQRSLDQQTSAHREETKKLKAYIVKMKKELADLRGKMATPSEEREDLQRQLEELRASVETGQQSVAESESRRVEAEEDLKNLREETDSLQSERDGLQSSLAAVTDEVSTLRSELSTAQSDLVTFRTEMGGAQRAAETAKKEAESLREELARERETHSVTKQKLTAAVKEAKVTNVMNLELADYQRSLQSLEEKLAAGQRELEQARDEGRKQQDKMDTMRKEIDVQTQQSIAAEDRLSKTKALWMKTKRELDSARKTEGELQANMVSLNAQLEAEKQLTEQNKADMSALTAKLQSLQQQADSSVGVLQKTVRSLEHKLAASQNELTSSQLALSQCQQDYNNYKVRVHSVLKQKSNGPSPAEISTEIRQKFETEIIQLRAELQENKAQLSSALVEMEEVSEDHQQLTARHTQLLQDSQLQLTAANKKLEEAEYRHGNESREQAELIGQLRQEVVEVTEAFRGQLHGLQEDQQRVVQSLQQELDLAKNTLTKLQQEADAKVLARANSQPTDHPSNHTHSSRVTSHVIKLPLESVPNEQRSAGEGMDQSELDSNPGFPQSPLSCEDSQMSFERLLSVADSEGPTTSSSGKPHTSSNEAQQLHGELSKATKTIRGLNELLRESEESTVRLGEQAKLLKAEIRRLERNKEREEGVSNMEYLKNVVLKFLHSEDSVEQSALIPVITQLLRLSPQEMKFLQDTIKGSPASLPDAATGLASPSSLNEGLAGYIHRWTGY